MPSCFSCFGPSRGPSSASTPYSQAALPADYNELDRHEVRSAATRRDSVVCDAGKPTPTCPPCTRDLLFAQLKALYDRSIALNSGRLIVHGGCMQLRCNTHMHLDSSALLTHQRAFASRHLCKGGYEEQQQAGVPEGKCMPMPLGASSLFQASTQP